MQAYKIQIYNAGRADDSWPMVGWIMVIMNGWDQGKVFLTNFLRGFSSMMVSSMAELLLRKVLQIWEVGTASRRVELRTYWVVGSSWMVWMCMGIGMLRLESWIAMGVSGLIISASSAVSPPVFCRLLSPFWMIFSTSYFAIRHRSYVPVIVTIFRFRFEYSSLLRHTNAPVFAFIPFIVSPPFPIISPISLTGISSSILCDPFIAPLFIFLCVSTMKFSSFRTRSTDSGSPSTKMFRVFAPGALDVATCTFIAPDFLAMFLMVSPSFPMTSPTHSLGTSRMYAFSEGGPYGVVRERLKSPSASPIPCWQVTIWSFLILLRVSSSEKMMRSISAHALATCASPSPSTSTWRSSSSSQSPVWFCEPFPLTKILHPVFSSSCFWLLPLGPMSSPVQLKLLSLGSTIFRLILEASFIIEKTPVLRPMGKLVVPSTRVMPMARFLLAGLSFFMRERFLTSSLEPQRLWWSLDLSSPARSMVASSGRSENLLFFFQEEWMKMVLILDATYFCCGGASASASAPASSRGSGRATSTSTCPSCPSLINQMIIYIIQFSMVKKEQRAGLTETALDTTINIHKLAHRTQFKKKAPKAIKEIKKWVAKMMRTPDVRVDPKLNQFVWSQGVRNLPHRVRVRISRKRNEQEGASQGEFYSLVQHVHLEDFGGRLTEKAKVSA